ncbi:hypothetical protein FA95DRAFT_1502370 [Auriscalpium vulgare]|uniref:Uncharacterized protein n=1 Tax=Auriscalpium vulgare TaxID=40419 RepID=A0ACB8RA13_9AGAM|nr:hypothetical protein FA95DRAFT_1502370 [Auriscalpium vulgare]
MDSPSEPWAYGINFPRPHQLQSIALDTPVVPQSVHLLKDGKRLMASYLEHGIVCWSFEDRVEVWQLVPKHERIGQSALSPDETMIAVANLHNGFDIYRAHDQTFLYQFPAMITANVVLPVLFSQSSVALLCGSPCGFVTIHSIRTKGVLHILDHPGMFTVMMDRQR